MTNPEPIDYATPVPRNPVRGTTKIFLGIYGALSAALAIIAICCGTWEIKLWLVGHTHGGRIRQEVGERGLPIGIASCLTGLLLLTIAVYLLYRATKSEASLKDNIA